MSSVPNTTRSTATIVPPAYFGPAAKGRALIFDDEFGGSGLDRTKWTTCYWWDQPGCTILTNNEAEWYQPGQVRTANGSLQLASAPSPSRHLGRNFTYTSGMISSGRSGDSPSDRPRFSFQYGLVEAQLRIPKGNGLWPAFWMLPVTNEPLPEIDIIEAKGSDPTSAALSLHTTKDGPPDRADVIPGDLSQGWHEIAIEWSPGLLRWFIDGTEQFRVEGAEVPAQPMYPIANLAVGGPAGAPDATTPHADPFQINYIRVWR